MALIALFCSTLLLGASACSATPAEEPADPGSEGHPGFPTEGSGELNLYNFTNYISPDILAAFAEETGQIKVNVDTFSSGEEMVAKVKSGTATYDVVAVSAYLVEDMVASGLLKELDLTEWPNGGNIETGFIDVYFDEGRKYTTPYSTVVSGIGVDTDVVTEPITFLKDYFAAPASAIGGIGLHDSQRFVIDAALMAVGSEPCTTDGEAYQDALDLLNEFKANIKIISSDGTIDRLAGGETVLSTMWNGSFARAQSQNPSLEYVFPEEGFMVDLDNWAILANAQNADNAKIFMNWMLDPEHAGENADYIKYSQPIKGIEEFLPEATEGNAAVVVADAETMKRAYVSSRAHPSSRSSTTSSGRCSRADPPRPRAGRSGARAPSSAGSRAGIPPPAGEVRPHLLGDVMNEGPLDGLLVVDLSRALAGPHAGMMLGDLGARVIKVETPGSGDDTRQWGPPFMPGDDGQAHSTYFLSCNRNKESIALDLKSDDGRAVLRELVLRADVLIENFRTGVMDRLGIGTNALAELNPRLVQLSITGFGHDGPEGGRAGYDQIVQGEAGLMSLTGSGPDDPQRVGVPIADLLGGIHGVVGVLAALHERERTGRGRVVRTSLLASIVGVHAFQGTRVTVAGEVPHAQGNHHPSIAPYGLFSCRDGAIQISVASNSLWRAFCGEFGLDPEEPGLAGNPERVRDRARMIALVEDVFADQDAADLLARLSRGGDPGGQGARPRRGLRVGSAALSGARGRGRAHGSRCGAARRSPDPVLRCRRGR